MEKGGTQSKPSIQAFIDSSILSIPATLQEYKHLYNDSIENREDYWRSQAELVSWKTTFDSVYEEDMEQGAFSWFLNGTINACVNALMRHLETGGDEAALYYYDDGNPMITVTRRELFEKAQALAGAFSTYGVSDKDRVAIYMPDTPETVITIMACALAGVTVVPVPSYFTAEIVHDILNDCGAKLLFVSGKSGGSYSDRVQYLAGNYDDVVIISCGDTAVEGAVSFDDVITAGGETPFTTPVYVDAEHPLFILYTNSASGIPRGSVFATGGYCVQAASTFATIFASSGDISAAGKVYAGMSLSTAAGLSYGIWGPLILGSSIVLSSQADQPTVDMLCRICDNDSPPAILGTPRLLSSLKQQLGTEVWPCESRFPLFASCGDMLTPRLVRFAGNSLVDEEHHVVNMWIQSESGTSLILAPARKDMQLPGTLGLPMPGISLRNINHFGENCRTNESGQLTFTHSWPSMIRTIWGQQERFEELYFRQQPGLYATNDGIRIDDNGFIWFMGRLDDVIKVRGLSLATSEIEAVLNAHHQVNESVVVSIQRDDIEILYAFLVTVESEAIDIQTLTSELSATINRRVGEFAVPNHFIITGELPRTRTGKVLRRILRRIASGEMSDREDLSHVANPDSVDKLLKNKGR